jgi:glycosyltransferase involved in cell wall biosynthesis
MTSICIIAYTDYLTDARVMRQAESAREAGYAVDVVTPRSPGQNGTLASNGITVHRLRAHQYQGIRKGAYVLSYLGFFFRCLGRVSRLQVAKGFSVIQVCNMPDFLVFCAVFAKLTGARIILDIHDPMPRTYLAKFPGSGRRGFYQLILCLEKLSAAFADRVLTVHEPVKRDILVADGIPPDKISVIANFADNAIFRLRAGYAIGLPVRMVYYGTVATRFGFDGVLSAISAVRRRDGLFFKIIGKGDAEATLKERIKALGLEKVVEFENTAYPLRELPEIVGRYHLGLVPYSPSPATDYMLPVKLMELLAMGIPAITVPNTAIRFYLDDRLYFAYDPRNMETLTRLLDRIVEDPSLLLGKRDALLGASERFLWTSERSKYLDILSQLSN